MARFNWLFARDTHDFVLRTQLLQAKSASAGTLARYTKVREYAPLIRRDCCVSFPSSIRIWNQTSRTYQACAQLSRDSQCCTAWNQVIPRVLPSISFQSWNSPWRNTTGSLFLHAMFDLRSLCSIDVGRYCLSYYKCCSSEWNSRNSSIKTKHTLASGIHSCSLILFSIPYINKSK